MKYLIALLMLLASAAAQAAAPSATFTASRTSGTAPLCVVVDATGTTDADTTDPFADLLYIWNFGNSAAGTWTTGANTAASKNTARGAVSAHCYESAGKYTISLLVSDSTATSTDSEVITVSAFSGTTYCITSAATVVGCTGTEITGASGADFDAALATCLGAGAPVRCLFDKAGTYTPSTTGNVGIAGMVHIGSYGTGSGPTINATNIGGIININNAAVDDLRITDLVMVGSGASDTGVCINLAASVANVSIINVTCSNTGKGFTLGSGSAPSFNVCTNCVVQDSHVFDYYSASGGNALFFRFIGGAVQGNTFGPTGATGEHVVRMQRGQKVAILNNTILAATDTKTNLTMRADVNDGDTSEDSFYVYAALNKITQGSLESVAMATGPSADSEDARLYNFVIDSNYQIMGADGTRAIAINGVNMTVRNNICDLSLSVSASVVCVLVDQGSGAVAPLPDNIRIYNNTAYGTGTGVNRGVWLGNSNGAVTDNTVINNLCYLTGGNGSNACLLDQGSGTTDSNNTGDFGTITTNPFAAAPTTPATFRVTAASYAADNGAAQYPAQNSDFFNCFDKSSENRIGAIVQAGQQQCRSTAGP